MITSRFDGHIAATGTRAGVRVVVGCWDHSPPGAFADVMVELPTGHRILLAPDDRVAEFVAATYTFDEIRVGPVQVERGPTWTIVTEPLRLALTLARRHPVAWPLRLVPGAIRERELWARFCDPIASRALPGVRTHGSAGGGRTEWYAARDVWRLAGIAGTWEGEDLGAMAPVRPAVRFGFGSAPASPSLTRITSFVRESPEPVG